MAYRDIRQSKSFRVVVIIVCVILALAMTIPSIAVLLRGSGSGAEEAASEQAVQTSVIPDASTSLADANAYFQKLVDDVQAKVDEDATNASNYRMLGNNYASWAENLETYHADDAEAKEAASGCWVKAAQAYKASLDITYNDPVAYNYALALHESGDNDAALATLEQLVVDAPNYTNAWALLSHLYDEMGETEKAEEAYSTALTLSGAIVSTSESTQTDTEDSEGE